MTNEEEKMYLENAMNGFGQKGWYTVSYDEFRTKMEIKVNPKVRIEITKYKK